jgi:hypothetical protein
MHWIIQIYVEIVRWWWASWCGPRSDPATTTAGTRALCGGVVRIHGRGTEGKESFMEDFHYLTGMDGKDARDETTFVVTDGEDFDWVGVRDLVHEKNKNKIGDLFENCYYLV